MDIDPRNAPQKAAESFPAQFDKGELQIKLSFDEFALFEAGIFSRSMDEKWDIIIFNGAIYFFRSWTGICIYKVYFERFNDFVILTKFEVNRDPNQYTWTDLEYDTGSLKRVIQFYLNRDDIYVDPRMSLPMIQAIIQQIDPEIIFRKSVSTGFVGVIRTIFENAISPKQRPFCDVTGWEELKQNISDKQTTDSLIDLCIQYRTAQPSKTYHFDSITHKLLGTTSTDMRKAREYANKLIKEKLESQKDHDK